LDVDKVYNVYVALKVLGFGRASQISELAGIPLRTTYLILGRDQKPRYMLISWIRNQY
jgi:hypothetical protein